MDSDTEISSVMPAVTKIGGKKNKKSGGFQSMNLSFPVLRAILKKGYKIPTPIQRKAIPVILEGKNVVAMARTGSGKTAAFLVPMLEKLKCRVAKSGARALIFSPTRELAMQTMKFVKDLSFNTDLKTALVLGGEKIENQFAAMHESPDIIVATPGRFLHLVVEMDMKLSSVQYVVLDEADRLFEMGFQEQLQEVLHRLPSERQTLLFSATLPKVLVEFVKMGVEDPVLIRLDVDLQISENLKSTFLLCRTDEKVAILMYLLKNVVNLEKELSVVFLSTKHHVEYVKDVLEKASIPCTYIYSSLDQMARSINIAKFRMRKVCVLLVTDIAARGIDIPLLDNVINYNFPAKPKLYVHRVGRVARAGRSGRAFSLLSLDETPYLLDLHLFLGKPVKCATSTSEDEDGVCGAVPQSVIDEETDILQNWHKLYVDLSTMLKVTKNASKQYLKSRPVPSSESVKRVKDYMFKSAEVHPIFRDSTEDERNKMLEQLKNYRPNATVFEFGTLAKSQAHTVMNKKRKAHTRLLKPRNKNMVEVSVPALPTEEKRPLLPNADEDDLQVFATVTNSRCDNYKKNSQKTSFRDNENYLSYQSTEHYKEKGLGLESTFERQAANVVLDFTGDDDTTTKSLKSYKKWDRKKKKFVQEGNDQRSKKMRTESGVWIPKTYKSDLYKKWQEKSKIKFQQNDSDNEDQNQNRGFSMKRKGNFKGKSQEVRQKFKRPPKREMKNKEEILKSRKVRERRTEHMKKRNKLKVGGGGGKNQYRGGAGGKNQFSGGAGGKNQFRGGAGGKNQNRGGRKNQYRKK